GYNGMIMEDATGNQRLDFQAQKDMNTKVLNDQSASIGNNRSLDVTGNDSTTIGQNRTIEVAGSESTTVGKGRSVRVSEGNDTKHVDSGSLEEIIPNGARDATSKTVKFDAAEKIELLVGESLSIIMGEGQIQLKCGTSTITMDDKNILLESAHVGLNDSKK
uniref:bacteriophage T4 gp5 trimerisation domain-containing protein n=1 Tax=Aggregatibacter kilianii TaxID=2025884 RepID=UPI00195502BF